VVLRTRDTLVSQIERRRQLTLAPSSGGRILGVKNGMRSFGVGLEYTNTRVSLQSWEGMRWRK
jgi:hypothetical protein